MEDIAKKGGLHYFTIKRTLKSDDNSSIYIVYDENKEKQSIL